MLPEDTLVYVSIRNPSGSSAFEQSALGKIAREPEMKAFLEDVRRECARLLTVHGRELPLDAKFIEEVLSDELTLAFSGMQMGAEGAPEPGLVITCNFRSPPAEAEEMLQKALLRLSEGAMQDAQPAFEHRGTAVKLMPARQGGLFYAFLGQRLLITLGPSAMRGVLDRAAGEGASLADSARFKKVMGRVGGTGGTLGLYANTEAMLAMFGPMLDPEARTMLHVLGLDRVQAVGLSSRFAHGGMRDSIYLYAPGERGGILPPAGQPVHASTLLRMVPKEAQVMSLFRLDTEAMYQGFMGAFAQADPRAFQEITDGIHEAEARLGFRIQQDLLASLGTEYLFFQSPYETVLMVEVKDSDGFESCIGSLVELAGGDISLERMDYEGGSIRFLRITGWPVPFSPSYTFLRTEHGQFAVIGLYPQTLKGFMRRLKRGEGSILDSEDFKRVAGKFLAEGHSIGYQDIGDGLTDLYSLLNVGATALNGVEEVSIRPELLPPPGAMRPHMFGLGSGSINDEEGILSEAFSPLGASGGLLAMVGGYRRLYELGGPGAATPAIMAGMLVPSLVRARGAARRVGCMSQLRQIGLGIVFYVADEDKMPESLADLYPQYIGAQGIFRCPTDDSPMTIGDGIPCSFHYVGRLSPRLHPMVILVYEKRGNHPDGRNALFYDSHVEFIHEAGLAARLRESLALVKEQWDEYPPERQKAIEAFYSDAHNLP